MNKQGKPEIRARMRKVRANIENRAEKDRRICENILRLPEYMASRCVLFYMPIGSEVNIEQAMETAVKQGKTVCLPVCVAEGVMEAVAYTGRECLRTGAYGIREPEGERIPPEAIDLVLCPGLAFDKKGGRLGYGKGYYDAYLNKIRAFFAGICYNECILNEIPVSDEDVPMQVLISDGENLRTGGLG